MRFKIVEIDKRRSGVYVRYLSRKECRSYEECFKHYLKSCVWSDWVGRKKGGA